MLQQGTAPPLDVGAGPDVVDEELHHPLEIPRVEKDRIAGNYVPDALDRLEPLDAGC